MISVGLRSTRLQGIWAQERTVRARGTRVSRLSHPTTQARFPYARTHAEKRVKFLPQPTETQLNYG